jgi:predicted protein tyrosine phosphatase
MNILFVCSANKLRSKTADDYFSAKYPEVSFMSAGTNLKTCQKEGTTPLEEYMLEWADIIYLMENKHKRQIERHVGTAFGNKMCILNIPDDYKYFQDELIQLLEEKCTHFKGDA